MLRQTDRVLVKFSWISAHQNIQRERVLVDDLLNVDDVCTVRTNLYFHDSLVLIRGHIAY